MFSCILFQEKQVDLLPKLKQNVSTPEGVPRLYDLVKVKDERMKLAFFAALGNTVVANDLDQVRIHFSIDFYTVIVFKVSDEKSVHKLADESLVLTFGCVIYFLGQSLI